MDDELVKRITALVMKELSVEQEFEVPIGVSARHVHLSKEHIDILFGKNYELNRKKELMGGQFAAAECVTLVGTKLRAIENVRILGPARKASQVEVAKTDAIRLGINPPVRESGNIKNSAPIAVVGPVGAIYLTEGCIIAKRHIHMPTELGEKLHIQDGSFVQVMLNGQRPGVFEDVQIRIDESFTLEMHIDTDEANGMGVSGGDAGLVQLGGTV